MKIKDLRDFLDREVTIDMAVVISNIENKNNKGNPYYSLVLQDSTGTVDAKKWEIKSGDEEALSVKNVVKVTGTPIIFNNSQLQFKISDVEPVSNYDIEDLVIEAPIDKKELEKDFFKYLNDIQNDNIKLIVKEVVDKHMPQLLLHPAAKSNHHEYASGLLHHEVSMLKLAEQIANLYPSIDKDYLYGGIILHDLGKTEELSGPIATEYTLKGKLLGHISIIQTDIVEAAKKYNLENSEELILLQHIVLAHHGEHEYGSPVLPLTLEAEVVYLIDNLDSKIVMITKALKDVEEDGFSNRIPGLDGRTFYKH